MGGARSRESSKVGGQTCRFIPSGKRHNEADYGEGVAMVVWLLIVHPVVWIFIVYHYRMQHLLFTPEQFKRSSK